MEKISSSSVFLKFFYLIVGLSPILFYVLVQILLNQPIFDSSLPLFMIFISPWLCVFVKYGFLDWDMYINQNEFVFVRNKNIHLVDFKDDFKVFPIFFASFFFNVYKIKFNSGKEFYFKNKPILNMVETSAKAKELEGELKLYRNNRRGSVSKVLMDF